MESNHWSWSSYNYIRSCERTQHQPFYDRVAFWSKLERWKSLTSGCLMSLPQIKKKSFWSVIFLIVLNNKEPFLNWIVICDEKWILYNNQRRPAQWLDQEDTPSLVQSLSHVWLFVTPKTAAHQASLSITNSWSVLKLMSIELVMPSNHLILCCSLHLPRWIFPSITVEQKKVMVTIWWSAASLINYSFLNRGDTIISEKYAQQIDEMHWKLQSLQRALVNRKGPILLHNNTWPHITQLLLQSWMNWATKFCLIHHIHLISHQHTTILQASQQPFTGKVLQQQARCRKCFPRICWILKHGFLWYRNKPIYCSLAKCVDYNGFYFD